MMIAVGNFVPHSTLTCLLYTSNISHRFSMNFFGCCNISRTFGFYNTLINRQKALKGVLSMSVLQTIDLKKYYGTEPNITRALDGVNCSVNDGEFGAGVDVYKRQVWGGRQGRDSGSACRAHSGR